MSSPTVFQKINSHNFLEEMFGVGFGPTVEFHGTKFQVIAEDS